MDRDDFKKLMDSPAQRQIPSFVEALTQTYETNTKHAEYSRRLLDMIEKNEAVQHFVNLMQEYTKFQQGQL